MYKRKFKQLNFLSWIITSLQQTITSHWFILTLNNFPTFSSKTGDENIQTYQAEFVILIEHQTLVTNLQGNINV